LQQFNGIKVIQHCSSVMYECVRELAKHVSRAGTS
jgi:hypothetical protein